MAKKLLNPLDYVVAKRRKKYKFAWFNNLENCYEIEDWRQPDAARRVIVEMGAGTGLFAIALAAYHPDALVVAVDVKADRLQAGARIAQQRGVQNVLFLRAHADQLTEAFAEQSIAEWWLTFSDPFPKKRQAKHRMTHPKYLRIYQQLGAAGSTLHMKTDNHGLFDWSLEQLVATGYGLTFLTYDLHASSAPDHMKTMTTFEQRYVGEGREIYAFSVSLPRSHVSISPAPKATTV